MIGIISAMPEEMKALLDAMKDVSKFESGRRTYHQGILFDKEVVLVFSRWGKVAAAVTSTQLIHDFNPKQILFTGVAGAIRPELNIGDIIIGKKLYQYDMDARPFFDQFEIPIIKKKYFETDYPDKLMASAQNFINNYSEFIAANHAQLFDIQSPKVILGDIASGDSFVSSAQQVQTISKALPAIYCVEMEGAAIAQVCYEYDVPFSIIRIISDKADDNSHIDFAKFSDKIASHYALGILKHYLA